ncbi:hypothetical protein OIU77_024916 [Salix suchowensis]|uniref:Uncharacterized protein n=1 Tax=Salix suchowensis TaxID=1278906 RepID=A0ABQ9BYR6_9ROSI|nr:hypothetical protein OIU78_011645 [Salix suchowensis]KAJ6390797.1 hypothetical protein OIU77_024916 [Salix suchowensis]
MKGRTKATPEDLVQEEPSEFDDEARAQKGKMKMDDLPICTVNDSASLQSQAQHAEEESSATTAPLGNNADSSDPSLMEFIKVKKKRGGKKFRETTRHPMF